jgi:hydroxyacylglutathione hydrolase
LIDEGSRFEVGDVEIRVLHVPGHTPEHLAFLVTDRAAASEPMGVVTGDFIFVGDVGRPDLLERAANVSGTMEESARDLYRSLQRVRGLPDYLQIWPGHGAGSACGKALGAVPQSTLGYEKRFNWAFGVSDEAGFIRAVLEGQPDPPRYFAHMKRLNRDGPTILGEVPNPAKLQAKELKTLLGRKAIVVDTRPAVDYRRAALTGTINIPANKSFTTWAGSLLPYDQQLYLIVDSRFASVAELARDLAGIGLEHLAGYSDADAIESYRPQNELQSIASLTLDQVRAEVRNNDQLLVDVRGEEEWSAGHIPGSVNLPLAELENRLSELPRNRSIIVHCQTGSRAAIGASLLRARGYPDVRLFSGGFAAWTGAGLPLGG